MRKKIAWITGAAAAAVAIGGASVAVAASTQSSDDQPLSGTALQQAGDAALARTGPGTVISAETDSGANSAYEVDVRLQNGDQFEVTLDASFQVVNVDGPERDDDTATSGQPLSDADREKATNAALAGVGQGTVTEVERENNGGAVYEVEVRLDDGSEVDVELGAEFQVLNTGAPERD